MAQFRGEGFEQQPADRAGGRAKPVMQEIWEKQMSGSIKAAGLDADLIWSTDAFALGGNAEHAKTVFNQCKIRHAVGPGAKASVGPEQNNLVE
jgi:cytochrome c2